MVSIAGSDYKLKWLWFIDKDQIIENENTLYFHPDTLVPFIQKAFGSMITLDIQKKINHEKILMTFAKFKV